MKSFSFRRMAMFCRLQAGELYFRQPWKSAAALALIVVFVTALPLLSGNGSMEEMMAESEDLVKVLITGQIVFLYLDLVSERRAIGRMMIPATYLEKYAALYAGAALAGIIMTVFASVVGAVGYTTAVSSTFPVGSTTASLQPVRKAGSQPSTTCPAMGGCISSCSKFLAKTRIAPSWAFSVRALLTSRSMEGPIRRR